MLAAECTPVAVVGGGQLPPEQLEAGALASFDCWLWVACRLQALVGLVLDISAPLMRPDCSHLYLRSLLQDAYESHGSVRSWFFSASGCLQRYDK